MFIKKVISYGSAWNDLVEHFPEQLEDIKYASAFLTPDRVLTGQGEGPPSAHDSFLLRRRIDELWTDALLERGWAPTATRPAGAPRARFLQLRALGPTRNRVSVSMQRQSINLNRWLYTFAPLATRSGFVDIPIAVMLDQKAEEVVFLRNPLSRGLLEVTSDELLALSPLSHSNPFLLLGLSTKDEGIEVVDLPSEADVIARQIVINRSIEFPPEYHQAGLGILSYFGNVLREKYPDHNAKVKIEQDGLRVRLIVESKNGDREVIEKALQEYELVVRGESEPEAFFSSSGKVLELKNELRIAEVRIEAQRDLITYQSQEITTLRTLIGHSLTVGSARPLYVEVSPIIHVEVSQSVVVNNEIPIISEILQELATEATDDASMQLRLLDLEEAVGALGNKRTPEAIKQSTGLAKLRKFLDEANEAGTGLHTFLSRLDDGVSLAQKVARRYNTIAEWCGAPQVPSVFLGRS
jgi:hypothetical protein